MRPLLLCNNRNFDSVRLICGTEPLVWSDDVNLNAGHVPDRLLRARFHFLFPVSSELIWQPFLAILEGFAPNPDRKGRCWSGYNTGRITRIGTNIKLNGNWRIFRFLLVQRERNRINLPNRWININSLMPWFVCFPFRSDWEYCRLIYNRASFSIYV